MSVPDVSVLDARFDMCFEGMCGALTLAALYIFSEVECFKCMYACLPNVAKADPECPVHCFKIPND